MSNCSCETDMTKHEIVKPTEQEIDKLMEPKFIHNPPIKIIMLNGRPVIKTSYN